MGHRFRKFWNATLTVVMASQLFAEETITTDLQETPTTHLPESGTDTPLETAIPLEAPAPLETSVQAENLNLSSSTVGEKPAVEPSIATIFAPGLLYAGPKWHEDAMGITFGADYILWQVVQEGLDTVANNYYAFGSALSTEGSTSAPPFHPLSGFKVHGMLTLLSRADLDLFFQYSWLQRLTQNASGSGSTTTVPLFAVSGTNPYTNLSNPVLSWSSIYHISYNVLDFETGRLTTLAEGAIDLRPFVGIRGVWNQSTWTPSYIGILNFTSPNLNTNNIANSIQNTGGAGIRAGLDYGISYFSTPEWLSPLKLSGTFALSGVYGRTSVNTTTSNQSVDSGTHGATFVNNQSVLYRIIPVIDLSIGFCWNHSLSRSEQQNLYNLELHALWETQSWINYGKQFAAYTAVGRSSNLTVQGLTLGATFSY